MTLKDTSSQIHTVHVHVHVSGASSAVDASLTSGGSVLSLQDCL